MSRGKRGADLVMKSLAVCGVERVFTLSGNQIMPLFDASIDEGIDLVHVRHEAAAVHMADAWGRLTGQPGIAMVTAGPGVANTVSAMYVALAAESPLVLISGQAPTSTVGRGAFQEMPQAELLGHVCKASWTVRDASQLGVEIGRAMRFAISGRPGPVHLAIPVDLQTQTVDDIRRAVAQPADAHPTMSMLDREDANRVFDFLEPAERPLILAGPGHWNGPAADEWQELLAAVGISGICMESPRGPFDPACGDLAAVLAQADRILLLGKRVDFAIRFGDSPTFDADCQWFHIDSEMAALEHSRDQLGARLLGAALADSVPAAQRLTLTAADRDLPVRTDWLNFVDACLGCIPVRSDQGAGDQESSDDHLHPEDVLRVINDFIGQDESICISDGGEFGQWAQAVIKHRPRLINGLSGSIGSSVPFAIAAKFAQPEAAVFTFLGDGTFGFHASEFETAVRYSQPFVAIVGNDSGWHAEREIQRRDYGEDRMIGCDLDETRYDEVVRAFGGHSEFVETLEQLVPALERAVASKLPACINIRIKSVAAPSYKHRPAASVTRE